MEGEEAVILKVNFTQPTTGQTHPPGTTRHDSKDALTLSLSLSLSATLLVYTVK